MITLQHTLSTLLHDKSTFHKVLPYALLPDAIRMFTGERQYSHFEKSFDDTDVSYMEYPLDIKNLTKEDIAVDKSDRTMYHLVSNIKPCCIGEDTDISAFYQHNMHLPETYHKGVELHLKQDICFDKFIRDTIDCSHKYEHEFKFHNKTYGDKEIRSIISDIEQYGVYVLAKDVYDKYNIVANQQWLDENVKPSLDKYYSSEMSENTYKYMKIRPDINEYITNKDWTHMKDMPVSYENYHALYDSVLQVCKDTPMHTISVSSEPITLNNQLEAAYDANCMNMSNDKESLTL